MSSGAESVLADLVRELCARNPDLVAADVDPDAELLGAGYLDSLSATEFLSHLETTYGVTLGIDRLVGDLATMQALAAYVAESGRARC